VSNRQSSVGVAVLPGAWRGQADGFPLFPGSNVVQNQGVSERSSVASGAVWESVVEYSRAVRMGSWIAVSGTTAATEDGGAVEDADIAAQTRKALRRIGAALGELGAGLEHVVRTRMYLTDISRWEEVGRVHGEVFGSIRPATSMVEVTNLIAPALLVEIEADAIVSSFDQQPGDPHMGVQAVARGQVPSIGEPGDTAGRSHLV